MGVGSSNILPWLIPLTIAAYLSYGIVFAQDVFGGTDGTDFLDFAGGVFNVLTFTGAGLPAWASFVLFMLIAMPWAYVIYDLANEAIPG